MKIYYVTQKRENIKDRNFYQVIPKAFEFMKDPIRYTGFRFYGSEFHHNKVNNDLYDNYEEKEITKENITKRQKNVLLNMKKVIEKYKNSIAYFGLSEIAILCTAPELEEYINYLLGEE